jgi:glutathione S-transferase
MHTLRHYRLCPFSRSIRIALAELAVEVELTEEKPWEWRAEFLAINPSGELPVLEMETGKVVCGAYAVSEYLADEFMSHPVDGSVVPLFPGNGEQRAEVRRLVDWFHRKCDREVVGELLQEKLYTRIAMDPPRSPDPEVLRAIRANLRYHLSYIGFLADQRRWLAGDEMSFADIAAAAHMSCADYLGEVPWDQYPSAKVWYARMKSRPSFRSILADRVPGAAPPPHYEDLDF